MNKNWVGSNGVIGILALLASGALLLSAYSYYSFKQQNSLLNNVVSIDAGSSQLRVWNGNEWKNIGDAQPGQVLGVIDGKPGWIGTSEGSESSDSFSKALIGAGLARSGDATGYTLALTSCNFGQILQSNGTAWECATLSEPESSAPSESVTYSAGNGIAISGANVISSTLGTSIGSSELEAGSVTSSALASSSVTSTSIANGAILLEDIGNNGCNLGQILKFNGATWACDSDDAGAGAYTFTVGDGTNTQLIDNSDLLRFASGGTLTVTVGATDTVTLDVANNAITTGKILDGTILLSDLGANGCSNTQVLKFNGTVWICAADNDTDTTYSAGTGLSLGGTTFSSTLGVAIDSSEITDGVILFADLSANSCANTQIIKYNGSAWICGSDNVNDADASATNELQDLSLSVNVLSLSGSAPTINLAGYLDNTDSQNLSYVAGTQTLSIGGGNSVSLASLLDNTDAQAISRAGNTISISGNAGTVDLTPYLDNTDVLGSLSCGNTQIAKYNGSAWVCAADNDTDTTYSAGTGLTLTGTTFSNDLGTDINSTEILNGTILFADIASNSCANNNIFKYNGSAWFCGTDVDTDTDTTYSQGTGISFAGTVISSTLGVAIDTTEITDGTIDDVDIENATISNSKLANSSLTVTAGTGLTGGGAVSLGGTVTLNSSLGTAIDSSEITDGTILFGDVASNGCGNNDIIKYNGSVWVCGTDNAGGTVNSFETLATTSGTNPVADSSTDTLNLAAGTGVTVTGNGTTDTVTFAAVLGIDIDSSEITDGTIDNIDIANSTIANGKLVNSSVTVTAGTGLTGGGAVSLGGTVTLNSALGTSIDSSEIVDGTVALIDLAADSVDASKIANGSILFADVASNSCANNNIFKYNGSAWYCGTDVDTDTDTTYSQGTGISFAGTVISSTLGTAIDSSEITNGTITATDVAGDTFAELGRTTAQTDTTTNALVFLNKTGASGNLLQLQVAGSDVFVIGYDGTIDTASVDGTSIVNGSVANGDLTNSSLTVTAGTGLSGGGAVSLGGSVSLSSTLGVAIDSSEITDGSILFGDIAANSCGNNAIFKYNGSAWFCGTDLDTDTTYSQGTGISFAGTVISSTLGTAIDTTEITDGTIDDVDIENATISNSKLANSSLTVTAGTGLTGGGAVSLGGTVTLNSSLGTAVDSSEITDGEIVFADIASNSCGNNAIFKYNGSAWFCGTDVDTDTTYSAGTGISFGGTVISSTLGVDVDSSEIVNGTIVATDVAGNVFAELGRATSQTDTSTNALVFLNKTGASGNLLQLRVAGVDEFLIAFDGTIDSASIDSASIIDGSIANAELTNSALTVTAGSGLTSGGSVSLGGSTTVNIGAGNGITVNADDIAVDSATTGTTATTSSNSGIESTASGIRLIGGCSDGQILKWESSTSTWDCAADSTTAPVGFSDGGNALGEAGDLGTTDSNALNIMTSGTNRIIIAANGQLTIGDTAANQSITVDGGTGNLNVGNSNNAKTVNVGTGTAIDTLNIATGGTSADVITIGNATVATALTFNSGVSTTSGLTFNLNSLTTGDGFVINSTAITTGNAFRIVGPSSTDLFNVGYTTAGLSDFVRVAIGGPEKREQFYVYGRIDFEWEWLNENFLSPGLTLTTADGRYGNLIYDEQTGTGSRVDTVSTSGRGGVVRLDSATAAANNNSWLGTGGENTITRDVNPIMEAVVLATTQADQRALVGFGNIALGATFGADTNQSTDEVFFRKRAADTTWYCVTRAASGTEVTTDSTIGTGAYHTLRIELENAGTPAARFYIDGTLACTHTTGIPAATLGMGFYVGQLITGVVNRAVDIDYIKVWSE